jgi:hypothetical protein
LLGSDSRKATKPWTTAIRQYADLPQNPFGYGPNHATGVKLPDDFVTTPLQYVD